MFPLTSILEVTSKLIERLIPDPEAKAKAQLDLAQMALLEEQALRQSQPQE
jgi:hypothetical protein